MPEGPIDRGSPILSRFVIRDGLAVPVMCPVQLQRPTSCRAAANRRFVANCGLMYCSKTAFYSITSSARCWKNKGTSMPSALAVLRLIVSSYLVGACTGRSAGLSPLRILPV
jgi:hypothetical protein